MQSLPRAEVLAQERLGLGVHVDAQQLQVQARTPRQHLQLPGATPGQLHFQGAQPLSADAGHEVENHGLLEGGDGLQAIVQGRRRGAVAWVSSWSASPWRASLPPAASRTVGSPAPGCEEEAPGKLLQLWAPSLVWLAACCFWKNWTL